VVGLLAAFVAPGFAEPADPDANNWGGRTRLKNLGIFCKRLKKQLMNFPTLIGGQFTKDYKEFICN